MSTALKRRFAAGFVLAFSLWPLLQIALVLRYDADPWKLGAWGMYSAPGPMKNVRLAGIDASGALHVVLPDSYTPRTRAAAKQYEEYQRAIGDLASPDALLANIFDEHPDFAFVLIGLAVLELDRDSARVEARVEYTRYDRAGQAVSIDPSVFAPAAANAPGGADDAEPRP